MELLHTAFEWLTAPIGCAIEVSDGREVRCVPRSMHWWGLDAPALFMMSGVSSLNVPYATDEGGDETAKENCAGGAR